MCASELLNLLKEVGKIVCSPITSYSRASLFFVLSFPKLYTCRSLFDSHLRCFI